MTSLVQANRAAMLNKPAASHVQTGILVTAKPPLSSTNKIRLSMHTLN